MNAKSLWQKALLPATEPLPAVPWIWLRVWWMLAALLVFPSLFCAFMPPQWALPAAGLAGMAAGTVPWRKLSIKMLSLRDIASAAMTFPAIMLLSSLAVALWKKILLGLGIPFQDKQSLAELITDSSGVSLAAIFAGICLITPVLEEILFRRFIYSLWRNFHALSAFAGTALLFALIHCFLSGFPGLFILGCGFQYIFLKRRNLSCAILVHMLVNSSAFAVNCLGW